jgi:hypothetical protein
MLHLGFYTRYIKLRKLNLSTKYRYGLDLQTNRKNSHTIICILLAGDIAINPGPFNLRPIKNEKGLSFCHWNIQRKTPKYSRATEAGRTFSITAIGLWNKLPLSFRSASSINCFKYFYYIKYSAL